MDEKRTHASSGAAAHASCKPQAPCTFGAYTRRSVLAVWARSNPSDRTPAACHKPASRPASPQRAPLTSRRMSASSAASARATHTEHCGRAFRSRAPSASDTAPPRAASTTVEAPPAASHRPVSRPSPPVPPESRCVARGGAVAVDGMRMTTLPVFVPACRVRNAESKPLSIAKLCSGSPCSTRAAARADSCWSVPCIHTGVCSIVLSSAIAT
mmetsp:Transcript_27395/g.92187  ORF Transcript_27395/g.92187 Transcript_27395/m.92187 type:complete len:213 (-) Transcript_27395:114-752(-)